MKNRSKTTVKAIILILLITAIPASSQEPPRVIHTFVALCDNLHQGIVPVPQQLGNGDDPDNNLYWGALYGVKTYFKRSSHWKLVESVQPSKPVLERCIFKHQTENVYFVADAYQGKQIRQTVIDFLDAASGKSKDNDTISIKINTETINLKIHGSSHLIVYVGHDGLMDFNLDTYPAKQNDQVRETIILACLSKSYFREPIVKAGAKPLLWATGLMAPETYTLENAIEGWVLREDDEKIRLRAADAYHRYKKCGLEAAKRLLVTGL